MTDNKRLNLTGYWILRMAVLAGLGLFFVAYYFAVPSLWGVNHLLFLPLGYLYLFGFVFLVVALTLFRPSLVGRFETDGLRDCLRLALESRKWRMIIACGAGVVFYFLRIDTYLLGDGYTWLGNLGRGASYVLKWTEPGSTVVIRALQSLFGGYTPETALLAFQGASLISGTVVWYNILGMASVITSRRHIQALFLVTVLGSGAALLFAGYVEFYPLLWAAATTFLYQALRYLRERRGLWIVLLAFLLSVLMHLQSLYYAPAVLYLLLEKASHRFPGLRSAKLAMGALGILALLGGMSYYWLYNNFLEFEVMFLPFFAGRPASPEYSVFSFAHILDVVNLVFLMFPGVLFLIALFFISSRPRTAAGKAELSSAVSSTVVFIGLCTLGSVSFLLLVDPVLGLARDWDLFSLTLLPPVIFIFLKLRDFEVKRLSSFVIPYTLVCVLGTGLFLASNISAQSAEDRFHSILKYYGAKDRGGWIILANYLKDGVDHERRQQVLSEMSLLFPEDESLKLFHKYLKHRDYSAALGLAKEMYRQDPFRTDFLQALGNAYWRLKIYDSSNYWYQKAIALRPHHTMMLNEYGQSLISQNRFEEALQVLRRAHYYDPTRTVIMEGMGLTHYKLNQLDSALVFADSLFALDSNSPGGHLLELIVALQSGNREKARRHFQEYKKYGAGRSDYRNILEYHHNLEQ
jgi:Tetratricopeptide repeat